MAEIWKDIPSYQGIYQASNGGHIRCIATHDRRGYRKKVGNIIKNRISANGYLYVSIMKPGGGQWNNYVHRLIAEAFIGPCPDGLQVNHRNGDKHDNQPENIEYVTASENHYHSYGVLGKQAARGEAQGGSKLTESDVRRIREISAEGKIGCRKLGRMFNVTPGQIRNIVLRKMWKHIIP